jgi:hypothetical protein
MTARRIIGVLIIVFIAIPVLFGVIWAVGMVRASVSANFLSDLPQEIIEKLPATADAVFLAGQDDEFIDDPGARAWFKAAAKTGTSMKDLMQSTGITAWMQGELTASLERVGQMLRGKAPIEAVTIDMRPLKKALLDPAMDRFLEATVANLPPCDESGIQAWKDLASDLHAGRDLPGCSPDPALAKEALLAARNRSVREMDENVQIIEGDIPPVFYKLGISRIVSMASYGLLLIPALFILLGVLIGANTPAGRLRWSGITVLTASVPVLVLAIGIKKFSAWLVHGGIFNWNTPWTSDVGRMVLDKLSWIPNRVMDALFSPVISVAAVIAVVGIVFLALASSARKA